MLDFTSALYLGLRHPSTSLAPWPAMSAGRPAALAETTGAVPVAAAFAQIMGCETGTLLPSTLHLFWDLFASLPRQSVFYVDADAYPVARWGVERAVARGAQRRTFAHLDAASLRQRLARASRAGELPVVVTDGFCPVCARPAPIADLLAAVREYGGLLVIDDTQALGVLGEHGGGSLRHSRVSANDVLVAASLAKGFGVPAAMLAGSAAHVDRFRRRSLTRVHCSPVTVAVVRAAEHALRVNESHGDVLRARLMRRVREFRAALAPTCASVRGIAFPVQTLDCALSRGEGARVLHRELLERGVRAVLHGAADPRLSFIITARHSDADIHQAAREVSRCLNHVQGMKRGVR
ncbi:MAG TPA: aminotransferase class I/II-fold pyridoxal phosphate-dependent enzyme [Steroidobacteraceae bacterium]